MSAMPDSTISRRAAPRRATPRRAAPLLATLAALALAACGELHTINAGKCGNGAVDPSNGEDCDLFADPDLGPGTRCAAPTSAHQCQYVCSREAQGPACPLGWGCGDDGLCRRASGRYVEAPGSPMSAIFGQTSLADVDGDDVPDLVVGDFDGVKVRFGEANGAYDQVTGISLTLISQARPVTADFDGNGGDDVAFADSTLEALLVATSDRARQLRPAPFPVEEITATDADIPGFVTYLPVSVDARPFDRLLRVEARGDGHSLGFLEGAPALTQAVSHDLAFVTLETPFRVVSGNVDTDAADELVLVFDGENKARVFHAALDGAQQPIVQAGVEVTFPGPIFSLGVDLADVNVDTRRDLVAVFRKVDGTLGVAVALGNGSGGFAAPAVDARFDTAIAFESGTPFSSARPFLLAADVNGDKRADFLIGNGDIEFSYLYYLGAVHVATPTALIKTDSFFFLDAVTGDFNRDGFADFALATESGLDYRKGSANGFLTQHFVASGEFPTHLTAGDFDGDRADDVAFFEGVRSSGGVVPGAPDLLRVVYGGTELPALPPLTVSSWREVQSVAPALLDGLSTDATRDLVVAYTDGTGRRWLSALRGRGDRTFLAPRDLGLSNTLLVAGRFDGEHDGTPDLMFLDGFDGVDFVPPLLLRGGVAGFVVEPDALSSQNSTNVIPCTPASRLAVALDLEGDQVDEAVVLYDCASSGAFSATVMRLGGGGDFVQSLTTLPLAALGKSPALAEPGDVDADGKPDLMVGYGGDGAGYMILWNEILAGAGGEPADVTLGDAFGVTLVNADADLAQEVAVLEQTPGGSFVITVTDFVARTAGSPRPVLSLPDAAGNVHVGDVNGDGLDDFIVPPHVFFAVPFDPRVDAAPEGPGDPGADPDPDPEACSDGCELVSQCGCGDGEACDLSGSDHVCRPATGAGTETTECEFNDDCAPGYSCIGVLGLGRAECLRWCASDADCTAPGGACDLALSFEGSVVPGAVVCTPNCDPLTSVGCPEGWSCHAFQKADGTRHESICTPAGPGGQGDFCDDQADCQPNHTCLGFTGACSLNCAVSPAAGACPGDTTCLEYGDHPSFGGVEWGFCGE